MAECDLLTGMGRIIEVCLEGKGRLAEIVVRIFFFFGGGAGNKHTDLTVR